jgi:acyl-coenzyme A synthetase/AMP-(fatty) acid ligase
VLESHPSVSRAAVIGVTDARQEEPLIHAFVTPCADHPEEQALLKHCAQRLSSYKVPRRITIMPDLPLTTDGKVRKFLLLQGEEGTTSWPSTT